MSSTLTSAPGKAYLELTASQAAAAARIAFNFGDGNEATAISNVSDKQHNGTAIVYSINGVRQQGLKRGLNIVVGSDGSARKVAVK
jgi:hypothetical protein